MKTRDMQLDDSHLSDARRRLHVCQTLANSRFSNSKKLQSNLQPTVCLKLLYVKKQRIGDTFGSIVYNEDTWYDDEWEARHRVLHFGLIFVAARSLSLNELIKLFPVNIAKTLLGRAQEYLGNITRIGHYGDDTLLSWVAGSPPTISEEQCKTIIHTCKSFLKTNESISNVAKLEDPLDLIETGRLIAMLMSQQQNYCAAKIATILNIKDFLYHGVGQVERVEILLREYNSWRWVMRMRGIGKKTRT